MACSAGRAAGAPPFGKVVNGNGAIRRSGQDKATRMGLYRKTMDGFVVAMGRHNFGVLQQLFGVKEAADVVQKGVRTSQSILSQQHVSKNGGMVVVVVVVIAVVRVRRVSRWRRHDF